MIDTEHRHIVCSSTDQLICWTQPLSHDEVYIYTLASHCKTSGPVVLQMFCDTLTCSMQDLHGDLLLVDLMSEESMGKKAN